MLTEKIGDDAKNKIAVASAGRNEMLPCTVSNGFNVPRVYLHSSQDGYSLMLLGGMTGMIAVGSRE